LIASLKADLAAQNAQIKESGELKKTIETQAAEVARLQAKVTQLDSSLTEAQTENMTLSTKLAANRTAAASVESLNGRAPGSAVKPNRGVIMMGSAEVAQAAQVAQLKEDIYSDLTGLIIRGVKREAEEDVYDCIQTGRNGSKFLKCFSSRLH
jgi:chromosome segregation ATPase